jgi:hypothetical protein
VSLSGQILGVVRAEQRAKEAQKTASSRIVGGGDLKSIKGLIHIKELKDLTRVAF